MTTAADNLVPLTGDPLIDGLTQGSRWTFAGDPVLTYSFSDYLTDSGATISWTAAEKTAIAAALQTWSEVANLTFQESGSGTLVELSTADLAFAPTGNTLSLLGYLGLGIFPSPIYADQLISAGAGTRDDYRQPEGDVYLDNFYPGFHLNAGGYGFEIILHEIGHALGLKHPDDAGANGRPTFIELAIPLLDNQFSTVMSNDTAGAPYHYGNAGTPMPLDIWAIQSIYGANTSFHSGDDAYVLTQSDSVVRTIWDTGGIDTIDASGLISVRIDLRPGNASGYGYFGAFAVAYGVVLENALGGSAFDTLIGNDADNILDGGDSNDTLMGGGGNDTLLGGVATYDNDTAGYYGLMGDYVITAGAGTSVVVTDSQAARDGIDTLTSIELLSFSDGKLEISLVEDGLFGSAVSIAGAQGVPESDNHIVAGDGSQILSGWWGADTLTGGAGNDVFAYFTVQDSMVSSMDTITDFTSGSDVLTFDRMGGVALRDTPYAYQGSLAATIDAILGDGAVNDQIVFFSDGDDGYVYVKGYGYSTSNLNASLIRLAGHVEALTSADIVNSNVPPPPTPIVAVSSLDADHAEGNSGSVAYTFLITRSGYLEYSSTVTWRASPGSPYLDSFNPYTDWPPPWPDSWPTGAETFAPGETSKVITVYLQGDSESESNEAFTVALQGGTNIQIAGGVAARGVVRNDDASAGNNALTGTSGHDVLDGGAGNDQISTGDGSDTLIGGAGNDTLTGGIGDDVFLIQTGTDHGDNEFIDGGDGSNSIRFSSTANNDSLTLSSHISNIQSIAISDASGATTGTRALDINAAAMSTGVTLIGNAGANTLVGGAGNDTIDGGAGLDTVQYSGNRGDYTITQGAWYHYTITDNNPADGDDGIDAVFGVEQLQFAGSMESLQIANSWHGIKHRPITPFWAGTDWQVLDSQHDFDGSGKNDLLLHKPDGSVALWLMDGAERVAGAIFDPVPGRSLIAASIDYNGDGKTDLGWREADGSNSYWLMGSGWTPSGIAPTVTPPIAPPTEPLPPSPTPPAEPLTPPPPPTDGWW